MDAKMPDLWKSAAASYPNYADEMRLWFRVVAPDAELDQEVDPELELLFCHRLFIEAAKPAAGLQALLAGADRQPKLIFNLKSTPPGLSRSGASIHRDSAMQIPSPSNKLECRQGPCNSLPATPPGRALTKVISPRGVDNVLDTLW